MAATETPSEADSQPAITDVRAGDRLRLTEIFCSLQGEARDAGWPTVFVRLTGCPLRCVYCDTAYAFHGGDWWTIADILAEVASHRVQHVCVTGGEPLAQKRCLALLEALCEAGYRVSLETSGAIDVFAVDPRVSRVLDIKTPGSGECARNLWRNLDCLGTHDQIKFVICDRADYDWAVQQLRERDLDRLCTVWFSPSQGQLDACQLADWIVADRLPVRFQIQLHKALWGDTPGR
ncbi:MAG: 7-carboxy-7-deazaguanine synthase QueE [Xanthomonadaceae bacterium]|nr:7-carboxy-7-deazaguanine synthase QueE [Xanthomonadaceae bacterium]